eukprot:c21912_g3_i1 orf=629-907(-)
MMVLASSTTFLVDWVEGGPKRDIGKMLTTFTLGNKAVVLGPSLSPPRKKKMGHPYGSTTKGKKPDPKENPPPLRSKERKGCPQSAICESFLL